MSAPNYPPTYPPQPPYGPPRSGGSGATILAMVLAAAFVVATVIAAVVAHSSDSKQLASSGFSSAGVAPNGSFGGESGQANGGVPSYSTPTYATPTYPTEAPLPSTPTIAAPAPLEPEAINRVFQVYMNALLYHDLQGLKSATCPKLRYTETGTALNHHYINRWRGKPYTIYSDQSYVRITAVITQADNGVTRTYQWQVVRYPGDHYWVCGFFG